METKYLIGFHSSFTAGYLDRYGISWVFTFVWWNRTRKLLIKWVFLYNWELICSPPNPYMQTSIYFNLKISLNVKFNFNFTIILYLENSPIKLQKTVQLDLGRLLSTLSLWFQGIQLICTFKWNINLLYFKTKWANYIFTWKI